MEVNLVNFPVSSRSFNMAPRGSNNTGKEVEGVAKQAFLKATETKVASGTPATGSESGQVTGSSKRLLIEQSAAAATSCSASCWLHLSGQRALTMMFSGAWREQGCSLAVGLLRTRVSISF